MSAYFMITALLVVSIITNVTVEGIKTLLDESGKKYSSNIMAAICSVVVAFGVSVIYLVMNDIVIDLKIGMEILILMYLGFLCSTVGYDKVLQTLKQIQSAKDETT